jgi:hypothetical protein
MIEAPLQLVATECLRLLAAGARHTCRAGKALLRDRRTPRWVRPLALFAVAPIPGPVDEIAAVVLAGVLFFAYRPLLRDAWEVSR